ncbi:LemA family protein [Candidatus Bipolaricaulota bacterium]|nr:LemA family protein [Candidatus Bipolaricaulota bacterium]TFH08482.1 MAG: LemA family protein [Candidatus Atribacteria bacterium]
MTTTYVVLGVVALVLFWGIGMYNSLVRTRQHVKESWSAIDTELKRRYDLIPNLIETVRGYATHESKTLEAVIQARNNAVASKGSPGQQAQDENMLVGALRQLFAVVEAYPDLKANESFLNMQQELTVTEDRIQGARRFYNANARTLNTKIEVFPSNMIASMFGISQAEFFEVEDAAQREAPKVDFVK